MTYKEAKATFLLEYCGERCGGYTDTSLYVCENCEIGVAIEAFNAIERVETAITELQEQRYYAAAEIAKKAVRNEL